MVPPRTRSGGPIWLHLVTRDDDPIYLLIRLVLYSGETRPNSAHQKLCYLSLYSPSSTPFDGFDHRKDLIEI